MSEQYGYAGKILRADLSSGSVTDTPTAEYAAFLGGRGFAAKIYWDEVSPEIGAFDEGNRLIFALGPLAGIPVVSASRWGIYGKSPTTDPETFCYGNLGGRWGAELKFAGYDAIVAQGKSEKPVYLFLHDGVVELRDASVLWGKGAIETREALKNELGDTVKVVAIGPAGENMVTLATVLADNDASGSAGLGAVMGSKRLKAIAVKGTRKGVQIAQPEKLRELTDYYRSLDRGAATVWGMDFMMPAEKSKKEPCYGCLGNCIRLKYTADNGKTGKYMCQSGLFYLWFSWGYYGKANEVPFYVNKMCDDYGIDTWALQQVIVWLSGCYQIGLLTEERTGLPLSKLGSLEYMETLVRRMALREGFGDILARGLDKAAIEVGGDAPSHIAHLDPYDPRQYITTSLLWAMEPREPIQQLHEVGLLLGKWVNWAKNTEGAHVSSDVLRAIAKRFWGSEAAADLTTWEGKALAAKMIQNRQYAKECLIVCDFMYPIMDIEDSEDHVGDPTLESRLLSAVMGGSDDERSLSKIEERVFNMQRAVSVREGRSRDDDRLPEEWHTKPLAGGLVDPEALVPGKDGEVISRVGAVVDREEFERAKDEYYQLRGWDVATGLQTRETLEGLGLKEVADDLERRGLLRQ